MKQQKSNGHREVSRLAEWGKLWRPEILRAEAARNKAARLGQDQTAEKVRNLESGWCR
jgi:hypothetical protein